jgi:hypothetical protein
MLTNMHAPPAEGTSCDEHRNAIKPTVGNYNRHMGYVDKADRITVVSLIIGSGNGQKLFFHLLDLTIMNSFILLSSCGAKLSHRNFRSTLCETCWTMLQGVPLTRNGP